MTISEKAEIANTRKARGQDMLEEAAQELFVSKGHRARLAVMRVVLPTKGHFLIRDVEQSVIGDGDAMRVASQVMQNVLGPAKWLFGVHDPVFAKERAQKSAECLCIR